VYGVVTQSGGAISLTSKEGEGTTFLIHLPMETAEEDQLIPELPVGSNGGGTETILVVEEEKIVRELLCSILEERGYRVISADGASAALALAAEQTGEIALVLMDAELHRKPGSEVVRELSSRWPGLKVLLLAGYTEEQNLIEQLSDARSVIVEKPFTIEELTGRLRQLLDREPAAAESISDGTSADGSAASETAPAGVI
jgi:DNA-binding response OmpR family regulator